MIDDVKIYSADPDATYHAAVSTPEGTFKGSGTISGSSVPIIIALGNVTNGLAYVIISDQNASATGFTFNTNNNKVSITTTGSFNNKTIGTITGTFNSAAGTITSLAFSGALSVSNGSVTNVSSSELFFDCDGTTSQLQAQFKRRYMSGSWQVDTGNADRITSNTVEFVSGTGAVKRRGYSGGAVALNFQNDFSSAKTVSNIHFWVYNPSGSNITLRMWGYKGTNFGSNFETGSVTATAGQWTYCHMGFTSAAIYNFQIADFNNTGVYLTFDNIYLY